jgi:hypothetical protein
MKENKSIPQFIVDKLKDKIVTKLVLNSYDLYEQCFKMGILEDNEVMEKVINYLDENNIDINFNATDKEFYNRYRFIESRIKMGKRIKDNGRHINDTMKRVLNIKVDQRPEWLETYRDDEEPPQGIIENNLGFMTEIVEKYKNEIMDKTEKQPTPNIFDILKEIK